MRKTQPWLRWLLLGFSAVLFLAGIYLLVLVLTPSIRLIGLAPKTSIDLNTSDDAYDDRNRIQIEKINLEVPFFEGGADSLDKGAWHRFPERGNPVMGGNFILSAHRFTIGVTPAETRVRSPFYSVNKLKVGDSIRVFYAKKWFDYRVTRTYSVKPDAIEIEAPSQQPKLTLYSCTLQGSADGRDVIEATLQN